MNQTTNLPLKLSSGNYRQEIDNMEREGSLPVELGSLLKGIIAAFFSRSDPAEATSHLIGLAKQYVQRGIELNSPAVSFQYDVMVFDPAPGNKSHPFFLLVRKYPDGRLRYLDEI